MFIIKGNDIKEFFDGKYIPVRSRLFITTGCNLGCLHCYVNAKNPLPDELTEEEFYKIIDELIKSGLLYLTITGGEPLIKKHLVLKIIKYASKYGIIIRLNTNGLLIDEEIAKEFSLIPNFHVSISLDGPKEIHERIRGKGTFDKVVNNIKILRKYNVRVAISSVLTKPNIPYMEEMVKLAIKLDTQEIRFPIFLPLGRGKFNRELLEPDILDLFKAGKEFSRLTRIYGDKIAMSIDLPPAFIDSDVLYNPKYEFLKYGCYVGFVRLDIFPDGKIYPCDTFADNDFIITNCRNNRKLDFISIMNSSVVLSKIRESSDKLKGICGICKFNQTCRGHCRAYSYNVYKDLSSPNPLCQKLYDIGMFPKEYLIEGKRWM
ncbi:MAG: radical SAM protein [Sulfolobaceae archaeon]